MVFSKELKAVVDAVNNYRLTNKEGKDLGILVSISKWDINKSKDDEGVNIVCGPKDLLVAALKDLKTELDGEKKDFVNYISK